MRIAKLKIGGALQDELISYLTQSMLFDYINISAEMTILANEEFYMRTNTDQLNLIIMKRIDAYLYIDLIGGGGGTGLLSITWGSEAAFVKKAMRIVEDFCKTHDEPVERTG